MLLVSTVAHAMVIAQSCSACYLVFWLLFLFQGPAHGVLVLFAQLPGLLATVRILCIELLMMACSTPLLASSDSHLMVNWILL
jgi:hypothetical protein